MTNMTITPSTTHELAQAGLIAQEIHEHCKHAVPWDELDDVQRSNEIDAVCKVLKTRRGMALSNACIENMHLEASKVATFKHIDRMRNLLDDMVMQIMHRARCHDRSKLESPEVELFAEYTPKLSSMTYGSDEYNQCLAELRPALINHYKKNRHHPEHFVGGIDEMNLLDVLEMFCDWKAASERHDDGSIEKSIEHNAERFEMSPQLVRIFQNSVPLVCR